MSENYNLEVKNEKNRRKTHFFNNSIFEHSACFTGREVLYRVYQTDLANAISFLLFNIIPPFFIYINTVNNFRYFCLFFGAQSFEFLILSYSKNKKIKIAILKNV